MGERGLNEFSVAQIFHPLILVFIQHTLAIMNKMEHFKRSNFSSLKQSAT